MIPDADDPFAFEEDALAATALAVEDLFVGRDTMQEAAMYWARGNEEAAVETLSRHISAGDAPKEAWWMYFDMLRARGETARFEEAALDYAVRFGCSPPVSGNGEGGREPAGQPLVILPSRLDLEALRPLQEKLLRVARAAPVVRLDASRVREVDPGGAALLLALLKKLHDRGVRLQWRRLDLALAAVERARAAAPADRVLHELEIVWRTAAGQKERAEDLVLRFAETFEAIPPVWMSDPEATGQEAPAASAAAEAADAAPRGHGLCLAGDLDDRGIGGCVQEILSFARDHDIIEIDCSGLRRVDFVAAGMLYNAFAALRGQGKQVILRNVSQVVNALFEVLSMGQVATIQTKVY